MASLYNDFKDEDYAHYMISVDGSGQWDTLVQFWNDHPDWQPSTAWLWNPNLSVFDDYRNLVDFVSGVPQHFIIDRDGYVRYAKLGGVETSKEELTNVILELL